MKSILKNILIVFGSIFILMVFFCWMEVDSERGLSGVYKFDGMTLELKRDLTGCLIQGDSLIEITKWSTGVGGKFYVHYADSTKDTFHIINDSVITRERVIWNKYEMKKIREYGK